MCDRGVKDHDISVVVQEGERGDFKVVVNDIAILDKLTDPDPFTKLAANPKAFADAKPYPRPAAMALVSKAIEAAAVN
ncbi:hypothetical protein EMIHUDRAFT_458950 [Emiliania huxleyi CCMP1516]|uniref:Uncharacterized protein n=2 Tax=Emiliania huxleyi TaxID=2903 RepID=A0A0D3J289_EMIH1|nr:hypothetical protein EMIHUDRAFT_458950 [Emiliania huxleyi CCMP1516]EOD17624.1 hypothetical protein EMIHUDRAFT_458950 [Emiliania huxleyi CCMP1516]|eukprot:XP_005770053.1 hypothetical protein EMIHUDRAFT_458950 [Emiliania huxleyi CCMP1516]